MARQGAETRLIHKMRVAGRERYGKRLVIVKQHGGSFSEVGVSDLLCVLDGRFVAVEVKAPESYRVKGVPSVEKAEAEGATVKQQEFIDRVATAGGLSAVVASVEGFLALLTKAETLHKK